MAKIDNAVEKSLENIRIILDMLKRIYRLVNQSEVHLTQLCGEFFMIFGYDLPIARICI